MGQIPPRMLWLTPETAAMSGASGESLQFLIIQSQCSCRIYSVFVWSISASSLFPPQEAYTKHTKTSTHFVTAPASHVFNRQKTARWQMNTVTQLNTYLHFYYSYVLKFWLFVFVSVCVCVCQCVRCTLLKILPKFRWLFGQNPTLVYSFFFLAANMQVTASGFI